MKYEKMLLVCNNGVYVTIRFDNLEFRSHSRVYINRGCDSHAISCDGKSYKFSFREVNEFCNRKTAIFELDIK